MELQKKEKKQLTFEECLERAETNQKSENFNSAVKYYFIILSRFLDRISKDRAKFKEMVHQFIIGTLVLNGVNLPQKQRMLNFLIDNDNLNVAEYKPVFERMLGFQLVSMEDIQIITKNCSLPKGVNMEKALFEHNFYSLSKVFVNISIDSMCKFLRLKADVVQKYTMESILSGSVNAEVDESSQVVRFIYEPDVSTNFDKQLKNFLLKTKAVAEYVQTKKNK